MSRQGYSVQITRKNGTKFLSASAMGILPPVWTLQQRKCATAHKRELVSQGFKAKVVRVTFTDVAAQEGAAK